MSPLAALVGVEVEYRGRPALGPLDLELRPGEAVALVGPSGCGKSTALRLLAGLERPTRGRVERAEGVGGTAVVFQSATLMPWARAIDNVALPLVLAGVSRRTACARAGDALDKVGLAGAEGAKPAQLSGGMAMRVSLARALVTDPRLLLLDEPFAALDEITRRRLADDVLALVSGLGAALLFVTHNVEEAVYIAGRVVALGPGPGRIVGETAVAAPLPRAPGFRLTPLFREAAEAVTAMLEAATPERPCETPAGAAR